MISSFYFLYIYINIYLSIATQPSLCLTCLISAKPGFLMMRPICQRLFNATIIFGVKTAGPNLHSILLFYKNNKINAGTLNDLRNLTLTTEETWHFSFVSNL